MVEKEKNLAKYRHIIVGVDGSEAGLHAFEEALRLAPEKLSAVYVAPPDHREVSREGDRGREQAARALGACQELARVAGVAVAVHLTAGEPHKVLPGLAREQGGDLLVTGRRGLDLPEHAMMGSTTARVIGFSQTEVLVVPRGSRLSLGSVVVGIDGSRFSQRAAARALELAKDYGAILEATAALDAPPWFMEEAPEVAEAITRKLQKLVDQVAGQAEAMGIPCQGWVRQGPAYRVITELAQELQAGLIVVGSHGRTGLKRLLMGSVTERVIGYATCPVLVVTDKKSSQRA